MRNIIETGREPSPDVGFALRQEYSTLSRFEINRPAENQPTKFDTNYDTIQFNNNQQTRPKKLTEFANKNGLEVRRTTDNKLDIRIQYAGERQNIGKAPETEKGFKDIQEALNLKIALKILDLEKRYGIKIAGPGSKKPRQQIETADGSVINGKELEVRTPKLSELLGVEAAMKRYRRAKPGIEEKNPLTFYFLKNQSFYPSANGAATFVPDLNGSRAIVVDPGAFDKNAITEKDRKSALMPHNSIESILTHELVHNSEVKLFKNREQETNFYKKTGWQPVPGSDGRRWMIMGRNGLGFSPQSLDPHGPWDKIDNNGKILGTISAAEVTSQSLVKPPTGYLHQPHEMLAEGVTMLRLGGDHRAALMKTDSTLYKIWKNFDQQDIDRMHGKGKYMRTFDGKIVERTLSEEEKLKKRERQVLRGRF